MRSECINQLDKWHSLMERGVITVEQYKEFQDAILGLMATPHYCYHLALRGVFGRYSQTSVWCKHFYPQHCLFSASILPIPH